MKSGCQPTDPRGTAEAGLEEHHKSRSRMKKQLQNEADIVGLITKIQEQLAALDRKVDTLMNRSLPQAKPAFPQVKPSFVQPVNNAQPQGNGRPDDRNKGRPMFRAICADCKKECELPFKPSGDRPVYCKECFSRRKSNNTFKAPADNKPKEATPAQTVLNAAIHVPEPPTKEKKKSAAAKKSVAKKKVVSKKKKK
jgi:CxxC-x17-CxxC domain-containing protein